MSPETSKADRTAAGRVARHRMRAAARGMARVEVSVPRGDAPLLRSLAQTLREGGDDAAALRRSLRVAATPPVARTGAELVAFLRSSPLCEVELEIERDRSPGRPVDFE